MFYIFVSIFLLWTMFFFIYTTWKRPLECICIQIGLYSQLIFNIGLFYKKTYRPLSRTKVLQYPWRIPVWKQNPWRIHLAYLYPIWCFYTSPLKKSTRKNTKHWGKYQLTLKNSTLLDRGVGVRILNVIAHCCQNDKNITYIFAYIME